MSEQADFFEPFLHCRRRGPNTSAEAAESMRDKAPSIMGRILADLRKRGPATQTELSLRMRMDRQSINKRTSDLKAAGLIEDSGMRREGLSGRAQIVWRAT